MVSILQLVILIIPGVAFRTLILLAWCQGQGWGAERRWGRGCGWGGQEASPFRAGFLQPGPAAWGQLASLRALQAPSRGSRRGCPGAVGR